MHIHEKNLPLEKLLRIVNQFLPVIFWISVIFGFEEPKIGVISIIAALIHECGHVAFLRLKNAGSNGVRGVISGFRIRSSSLLSYREEILLYLSGPLANIVAAIIFSLFRGETAALLCTLNIATAISNLIPVEGYDGYGALHTLAEQSNPGGICIRLLEIVSSVIIFSFCILSIYFIDRFGSGYWIFAIFFASMLRQLGKWLDNAKYDD